MERPTYETLDVSTEGSVGHLTLDRPTKLNALSPTVLREVAEATRWLDAQPGVTVVVVRGAGDRAFSAGFDLTTFTDPNDSAFATADLGRIAADAIEAMDAVTIAAVRGHCIGGGVVLASACDLRVAADDASFAIPEVDLGIPLTWGGIPRLVREIGPAATRDLVLTCRRFDAAEALRLGFLNRVVATADFDAEVAQLAEALAAKSPLVLQLTSRQVRAAAEALVPGAATDLEAALLALSVTDPASQAAARAYFQRRL